MKHILTAFLLAGTSVSQAQFWNTSDPVRLAGTVNTGAEESIPVLSKDLSTLYFVRTMDATNEGGVDDQDIWYSLKDDQGSYGQCERLKGLNNKYNNAIVALGNDKMYLLNAYEGKKDMQKGLAVSKANGSSWSKPEQIEIPGLDIDGNFYGFDVSDDEKVIIVSYEGPGSLGKEDLYVSTYNGSVWSSLTHMGSTINSAGFEISPFLSPTNDTLFFSSNGFGGEGDADIFYSVKQGSWTNWSKPVNLGAKINSEKFDAYFRSTGSRAYWSSNRESELSDIYMVDILTPPSLSVSCSATNASVFKGTDGSARLTLEGGVAPYTYHWSNGANQKDIKGLSKGEYTVTVTDGVGQSAEATCAVSEPAEPVVSFRNLEFMHNFAYNKHQLTTSDSRLKEFLGAVEAQLKDGREGITIVVVSSASQVPTKTFGTNEKLAQTRADNIRKQLEAYFGKSEWKSKVKVEISEVKVQGPDYEEDSGNTTRYDPYQFIQLKTK